MDDNQSAPNEENEKQVEKAVQAQHRRDSRQAGWNDEADKEVQEKLDKQKEKDQ